MLGLLQLRLPTHGRLEWTYQGYVLPADGCRAPPGSSGSTGSGGTSSASGNSVSSSQEAQASGFPGLLRSPLN